MWAVRAHFSPRELRDTSLVGVQYMTIMSEAVGGGGFQATEQPAQVLLAAETPLAGLRRWPQQPGFSGSQG